MIYRVQREPTMASFWTAAADQLGQPFVPLFAGFSRAFSPSFTLPATSTVVPVSCNKSVQMVQYIAVGGSGGMQRDVPRRSGAAKLVGVDRWSRCPPSSRQRGTLRHIYAIHSGRLCRTSFLSEEWDKRR